MSAPLFWCRHLVTGELKRNLLARQRDLICSSPLWVWGVEPFVPELTR